MGERLAFIMFILSTSYNKELGGEGEGRGDWPLSCHHHILVTKSWGEKGNEGGIAFILSTS